VNGVQIGAKPSDVADDGELVFTAFDLHQGDTLRLGETVFWVTATEPICGEDVKCPAAVPEACLT
jgi:hypothetical protein